MKIFQYLPTSFFFGFLVGVGADQAEETDKALRLGVLSAREYLAGSAALGAAFGAIVIAVLALISVWFDKTYLEVLNERGGWDYAMRPFRVTGTISILTTLVAVISIFIYPVADLLVRSLLVGITAGLLMWSISGTLVVVSLLFEHGHERAETITDLKRGDVRLRIEELQKEFEQNQLNADEFQKRRDELLATLTEQQQSLLESELAADASSRATPGG